MRLIAPLVTPYTDDGSTISEIRLARLMRRYREGGLEGVVVGSDAGEFASLSLAERKRLLEWVMRDSGDMAIYVNVTAQTTAIAIDICQDAAANGGNGAILSLGAGAVALARRERPPARDAPAADRRHDAEPAPDGPRQQIGRAHV